MREPSFSSGSKAKLAWTGRLLRPGLKRRRCLLITCFTASTTFSALGGANSHLRVSTGFRFRFAPFDGTIHGRDRQEPHHQAQCLSPPTWGENEDKGTTEQDADLHR